MSFDSDLLKKIIKIYFLEDNINSVGKLDWYPPTQKEITKTFEISGVELIKQRVKYFKTENFELKTFIKSSVFHQLLISDVEKNGVLYCVSDYKTSRNMGQKTRYKFKILNYYNSKNISDYQIKLLDKELIMIR